MFCGRYQLSRLGAPLLSLMTTAIFFYFPLYFSSSCSFLSSLSPVPLLFCLCSLFLSLLNVSLFKNVGMNHGTEIFIQLRNHGLIARLTEIDGVFY